MFRSSDATATGRACRGPRRLGGVSLAACLAAVMPLSLSALSTVGPTRSVAVAPVVHEPGAKAPSHCRAPKVTKGMQGASGMPYLCHAFVVMFENHSYADLMYEHGLPYIHMLARRYGLAANYYGVTHPTIPNRVGFWSGQGSHLTDSVNNASLPYRNLIDQLNQHHISWGAYYQHTETSTAAHPTYDYKNSTLMLFKDIASSPSDLTHFHHLRTLGGALRSGHVPQFTYIGPNFITNMHGTSRNVPGQYNFQGAGPGGSVGAAGAQDAYLETQGNNFLATWIPRILHSPAWHQGPAGIFFFFDENNYDASMPQNYYYVSNTGVAGAPVYPAGTPLSGPGSGKTFPFGGGVLGGGHTLALVVSNTARHVVSHVQYNEYSVLRTLEQSWHLPYLGAAGAAGVVSMSAFFHGGTPPAPPPPIVAELTKGGYPESLAGTGAGQAAPPSSSRSPYGVLAATTDPYLRAVTDRQAAATVVFREASKGVLTGSVTISLATGGVTFSRSSRPVGSTFVPSPDDSGVEFAPSTVSSQQVTVPVATVSGYPSEAIFTGLRLDVRTSSVGPIRAAVSSGGKALGTVTLGTVARPPRGRVPVMLAPVVQSGSVVPAFVPAAGARRHQRYEIEISGTNPLMTAPPNQRFYATTSFTAPVVPAPLAELTALGGKQYWVRVRALDGGWSRPATFSY